MTIDISRTKTIVIGVMFNNLDNELGHHLVDGEIPTISEYHHVWFINRQYHPELDIAMKYFRENDNFNLKYILSAQILLHFAT